ncbi:MAG TPA: phospholipase [Phycisphaerales bacterium]|nr:phospholipase [Phycisphaerales bacterium]
METKPVATAGQHALSFEKQITLNVRCGYLLYLPAGYEPAGKKWPLMLFLHGAGERGSDLNKVKLHGPPKLVEQGKDLPFIVVSPQCPAGQWWPDQVETLKALVDTVAAEYAVDAVRIYVTGLSMGGYGTWALAGAYPDTFAAAAPICGGGQPFTAGKLKTVPVWAFHGAKDSVVPLSQSENMVEALNRAGGSAKLTVYPDANHDSWTATYDNPQLYEWLLQHTKKR